MSATSVLGLDLSLNGSGIAVDDRITVRIRGDASEGDWRLARIADAVAYYLRTMKPALAVIEGVASGATSGETMSLVHGAVRAELARAGVPFAYVYPSTLKIFATGDGKAEKLDMLDAVESWAGWRPPSDDEADAWLLRQMGVYLLTRVVAGLPAHRLRAMSAVDWPLRPGDIEWPQPYGAISRRAVVTKRCGHGVICLRNGRSWLHPFNVVVCVRPPK